MDKSKLNLGIIKKIKNTKKKFNLEADEYYVVLLEDKEGTETGLMLTERELKAGIKRFWNNTEDQPVRAKKGVLSKLFS